MTATLWWQISAQSPVRRSSAITLTLHWLTFGSQQFAKRPDMVRPSGGHARGALTPLGREEARGVWLRRRQRDAPTHVRPSTVVASLQQHPAAPPVGPIFPDAPVWTTQRRSGMPPGQGETRKQTGAQREPPVLPARGTAASTGDTVRETALLLRLDPLPVDQRRRGRRDGLRGASWLARTRQGLQGLGDREPGREGTAAPLTAKARDPPRPRRPSSGAAARPGQTSVGRHRPQGYDEMLGHTCSTPPAVHPHAVRGLHRPARPAGPAGAGCRSPSQRVARG